MLSIVMVTKYEGRDPKRNFKSKRIVSLGGRDLHLRRYVAKSEQKTWLYFTKILHRYLLNCYIISNYPYNYFTMKNPS